MPIANEDRERARRWLWAEGVLPQGHENTVIDSLAQSYAEVREEAEKKLTLAKRLLQTQQDLIDSYRMSEEKAHRAGMEEAARIACGPRHDGRGVSKRGQLHTDACVAIRAAMKEGKP